MEEQPHDKTEILDDPTGMDLEGDVDAQEGPPLTAEMIEKDLLPENLELFHAILELAQNPQGDRGRLYAALLGGTYLVPLAKAPTPNEGSTEPNEVTLEVLTLTGPNGELALPIFTHEAALAQWTTEPPPTIPLPGGAVFQLSAGSPMEVVAINPAGPFGGQVTRAEFEPLSQGVMPVLVAPPEEAQNAAQNVYIDVPMTPLPEETMESLAGMMDANPAIKSAHLFLMQMGDATAPELTLGIHAEGAASQWVEPQITRLMQQQQLSFDPYDAPRLLLLHAVPGAESVRNSVPAFFLRDDEGEELEEEPEEEAMMEEKTGEPEDSSSAGTDESPKKRGRWPFGRR